MISQLGEKAWETGVGVSDKKRHNESTKCVRNHSRRWRPRAGREDEGEQPARDQHD